MNPFISNSLDIETLNEGVSYLCQMDPDLKQIIDEYGYPPMWARRPGFPTLIHIILEQQVSLASAKAAFDKLVGSAGELTPEKFLIYTDAELKEFGFSRQKTKYGRELANTIINNELDLASFEDMGDEEVKNKLLQIKGIGHWTADIYLLMVLLRQDTWPSGDLALAKAVQRIKNLDETPNSKTLDEIAEPWRPWRAVAARILWHYYLSS